MPIRTNAVMIPAKNPKNTLSIDDSLNPSFSFFYFFGIIGSAPLDLDGRAPMKFHHLLCPEYYYKSLSEGGSVPFLIAIASLTTPVDVIRIIAGV